MSVDLIKKDFTQILPHDVSLLVFTQLNLQEVIKCCRVSKKWNALLGDNRLWRFLFRGKTLPAEVNIKTYISMHIVKPYYLTAHFQKICSKISLHQRAHITYEHALLPNFKIEIILRIGELNSPLSARTELKMHFYLLEKVAIDSIVPSEESEETCFSDVKIKVISHSGISNLLLTKISKTVHDKLDELEIDNSTWKRIACAISAL